MKYLDQEAFTAIEESLSIKLPTHFKNFHLYERDLIAKLRELQIDSNDEWECIATYPQFIIEQNRDFLQLPKYKGFAKNKICIGTDGGGNDSFMSLDEKDTNVYFLDHEDFAYDAGIECNEVGELKFDFENDDIDWAIFIMANNLVEYIEKQTKWKKEFHQEQAEHERSCSICAEEAKNQQ